jgi:hypothetical protein
MDRNFRRQTLARLVKSAGILTDMVEEHFIGKPKAALPFKALGSVGPGTSVMMPPNPVKPDGSVDIVIQIRGISGGDTKVLSQMGKNAVFITSEAGGMGSKENFQAYGNPQFINKAVGTVLSFLKKQFPDKNISLGKLTVSSFSGGGQATANLLAHRDQLPKGTQPPKFVFIDGLHSDPNGAAMKAVVEFANASKDDAANGELELVHSAVVPQGYASTTQVADHLVQSLGLQRTKVPYKNEGFAPASVAQKGGVKITQLYDKEAPYMAKTENGEMKPNVPGTSGAQHIQALRWALQNNII